MDFLKKFKEELIEQLFNEGIIKINLKEDFILKGGTHSPMFFDSGMLESSLRRDSIYSAFVLSFSYLYGEIDMVAGVSSGGISWGSTLAHSQIKPFLRVYAEPKRYGLFDQIAGELVFDGVKVLVVDDVVTTGHAAINVIDALRRGKNGKKAKIIAFCAIFDWDFPSVNAKIEAAGVKKIHLLSFNDVFEYGKKHNLFSPEEINALEAFYQAPH